MDRSIAVIKAELEASSGEARESLLLECEADQRAGVRKLADAFRKQETRLRTERLRLKEMHIFEDRYADFSAICGIDEVGRGPLAGPVYAAAVILPKETEILYINDSKKLSPEKRDTLYDEIMEKAIAVGIGSVSNITIDDINILKATYEAMRKAISELKIRPDLLLNDAVIIPQVDIKQVAIVKGDARSVSIAAASIVAKVTRDRLMQEYDRVFPGYGFSANKGYGSREHIEAIKKLGPTPIHRQTFIKSFI